MPNSTTKKQNRILIITLAVILAAVSILIGITTAANKSRKENTPPLDNTQSESDSTKTPLSKDNKNETSSSLSDPTRESDTTKESDKNGKTPTEQSKNNESESTSANTDTDVPVVSQNILPTFRLPVDSFVIKEHSGSIPVFSYTMNDYRIHNGLDFACSTGTPVCAAASGTVCEIKDDPMMGVCISLEHTGGAVTRYCGLSNDSLNLVKVGTKVPAGSVIGAAGDTALIESAEESHVHFELIINGEQKNPADYMKVTFLSDMTED